MSRLFKTYPRSVTASAIQVSFYANYNDCPRTIATHSTLGLGMHHFVLLCTYLLMDTDLFLVLVFLVVPTGTCLPCGRSTVFNCSTTFRINIGGGRFMYGPGGQRWMIQTPDGTNITLSSNNRSMVPPDFEFISPHVHEYTGLRVMNTNSNWNGTTFQCIAFSTTNVMQINDSVPAVTLEVGGKCNLH